MQMGSRLRPVPEKVLECLIEVQAPTSDEGPKLLSHYPESYEDVAMLQDVVPAFCFPFDRDTEMVDAVQHFTFVLTSIDSLYRFGFCRYPPKAKTCLCILSDLPAFEMFYGMLNTLAELENAKDEVLSINQFVDLVLDCQVPEPGCKFTVSLPQRDWRRQYNYPDPAKLPSIPENRNLTDYFSAVNPNNMIALFASMMFERRIIITSKKLSLLTACTYSAASLLYPMHWQHVFIPALPPSLIEYCCAPMPFLVGVHSSLMDKVRDMQLDEVVILDVDKNEIEQPFDDLDDIPSEAMNKLDSALRKSTIAIGDYISQQFLNAIVVLIGGYRDALKLSSDEIVFERELFVNSRPNMKPFLENLLTLQLFERFIHHRLEQLNSGKGIDDIFEEHVGLHTENSNKWATVYKQWVKKSKRDGSQFLKGIGGKTEKARHKANRFIHSSVLNVKHHSRVGWKEAVKGMKEKKKNFLDYVKGAELDSDEEDTPGQLQKCNSLPMRKINGIRSSPLPTRKSIGSSLHDRIMAEPAFGEPRKYPCPPRPPPRPPQVAPRTPPRPPSPYKSLSKPVIVIDSEVGESSPKLRPSMSRNPNEPPVKDLIVFYESQEDLTAIPETKSPFKDFQEFDHKSDWRGETDASGTTNTSLEDSKNEKNCEIDTDDDLLSQTMISLSADTRNFLRQSRLRSPNASEISLANHFETKKNNERTQVRKTLRELALHHRTETKPGLTHSGSCPSLFDPVKGNSEIGPMRSCSSTNLSKETANATSSNSACRKTSTNSSDPFLELITQRRKLKPTGLANGSPQWITDFD